MAEEEGSAVMTRVDIAEAILMAFLCLSIVIFAGLVQP